MKMFWFLFLLANPRIGLNVLGYPTHFSERIRGYKMQEKIVAGIARSSLRQHYSFDMNEFMSEQNLRDGRQILGRDF
ncbi:hypothetical protein C8R42DRAFT_673674 [Lentinula raphanica]|nr:hypothetical protein C8R42DRAFT_673674 [Lentinula raphanica]